MENAQDIIKQLKFDGYDYRQIAAAMCDGAYLLKSGISQDMAEEIHAHALAKLKSIAEFNSKLMDAYDDSEFWE